MTATFCMCCSQAIYGKAKLHTHAKKGCPLHPGAPIVLIPHSSDPIDCTGAVVEAAIAAGKR
jgi:hypothetical protein